MITEGGMRKASKALYSLLKGVRVVMDDGKQHDLTIYEGEADSDRLKIMGLLDDSISGSIRKVQLIDTDDEVFAENGTISEKRESEGLLVSFVIRLYEAGGEQ